MYLYLPFILLWTEVIQKLSSIFVELNMNCFKVKDKARFLHVSALYPILFWVNKIF